MIENTLSMVEAEVFDLGTHTVFIGEVVNAETLKQGTPLTYKYYHQHLKGKTPAHAPSFKA